MAGTRIPPAVNEAFVWLASEVCDRARMDYDEWMVNSQELVFHLQERWREGVELGLNTDDAKSRAFKLFGNPSSVAKSLRKPWLVRLLYYKRFRSERFGFFILAFFLYTWLVIIDKHWVELISKNETTPFQILLPFGPEFFKDGFGAMFIGFIAAGCVVLSKWQPQFKVHWVNQLLIARHLLLLVTGYALFDLLIRSSDLAYVVLPDVWARFSVFSRIIIPFCITHVVVILLGWFGSVCLLSEIWGRSWKGIRLQTTFAGVLVAACFTFNAAFHKSQHDPKQEPAPTISSRLNYEITGETGVGKEMRAWLDKKNWFKSHQQQAFIEQKQKGNEITQSFRIDQTQETYDFQYWYEDGAWKFHDLYLHSLRGVHFEQCLSQIIKSPTIAQGMLIKGNPSQQLTDAQKQFVALFFNSAPFNATKDN